MNNTWASVISALSGLGGAAIGGMGTYFSNKSTKILEWRQSLRIKEIEKKELLYSEFLAESARLKFLAIDTRKLASAELRAHEVTKLFALFGQIKLTAPAPVEKIALSVIEETMFLVGLAKTNHNKIEVPENEMAERCKTELTALRSSPV